MKTTGRLTKLSVLLVVVACTDGGEMPTGVAASESASDPHAMHQVSAADLSTTSATPFTYRAAIDPFSIHQLPDLLMHSTARKDVVIQQSIFSPGAGPWHTHPGPSFVYVVEGQIKLQRHNAKDGCTETQVYGPGSLYFEVANEVHRAVVMSETSAVLLVTRFNIPVGGAITIPAADPGC
jgi:quercetin dioxygenase-like cupin family protein